MSKGRKDLYLRLPADLHERVNVLSDRSGYDSMSKTGELIIQIGAGLVENPAFWAKRIQGMPLSVIERAASKAVREWKPTK